MSGQGDPPWAAGVQPGVSPLRGGSFSPRPLGGSPPGASAAAHGTPGDRPLWSPPYPAAAPASTTARPSASRRVRQSPGECHSPRAGTPRIVRTGPSSVKGTRRSFLTAPQKRSSGPTLDPGDLSASPAGLTARARPEARPDRRAANLRGRRRGGRRPDRQGRTAGLHRPPSGYRRVITQIG
jgi:hypothetical protein